MFKVDVFFKDGERLKIEAKYAGIQPDYGDAKVYFIRDKDDNQVEFLLDSVKYLRFGPGRYDEKEEDKDNG